MMGKSEKISAFKHGIIKGLPICFGYIPVAFTFGLMAVQSGMPVWLATFISLSNVTSAGQFAGLNIIVAGGAYVEIALTTLIINLRYMLMSFSLSQKIEKKTSLIQRLIFGFGITDEIFAVALTEDGTISAYYMYGLIVTPIAGWTFGTALGGIISGALPARLSEAMGIALYAMFIAIIIPPAKKSKPIIMCIGIAVAIGCLLRYIPIFSFISEGFTLIITTIITASIVAILFPVKEESNESVC